MRVADGLITMIDPAGTTRDGDGLDVLPCCKTDDLQWSEIDGGLGQDFFSNPGEVRFVAQC